MYKITAINNIDSGIWNISASHLHLPCELEFKFINDSNEKYVELRNLQFGFDLYEKTTDQKIQTGRYPENFRYVGSEFAVLKSVLLDLEYESDYRISIWSNNEGENFEITYEFSTLRSIAPYNDWIWNHNEKQWIPPVPMPVDGKMYAWNDQDHTWEIMDYKYK